MITRVVNRHNIRFMVHRAWLWFGNITMHCLAVLYGEEYCRCNHEINLQDKRMAWLNRCQNLSVDAVSSYRFQLIPNITWLLHLGPFSVSCSEQAQSVPSQSQARLLKWPAMWLAEHSLRLLQARDRKLSLVAAYGTCWQTENSNWHLWH